LRASKSPNCSAPASTKPRIWPLLKAVIHAIPSMSLSSPIALCEIMPRSPTSTTRSRPKDSLSFATCGISVLVSAVFPSYTNTEIGHPCRVVISP
jgi:hypothetical protein